jgi:hypothetical protein
MCAERSGRRGGEAHAHAHAQPHRSAAAAHTRVAASRVQASAAAATERRPHTVRVPVLVASLLLVVLLVQHAEASCVYRYNFSSSAATAWADLGDTQAESFCTGYVQAATGTLRPEDILIAGDYVVYRPEALYNDLSMLNATGWNNVSNFQCKFSDCVVNSFTIADRVLVIGGQFPGLLSSDYGQDNCIAHAYDYTATNITWKGVPGIVQGEVEAVEIDPLQNVSHYGGLFTVHWNSLTFVNYASFNHSSQTWVRDALACICVFLLSLASLALARCCRTRLSVTRMSLLRRGRACLRKRAADAGKRARIRCRCVRAA